MIFNNLNSVFSFKLSQMGVIHQFSITQDERDGSEKSESGFILPCI